MATIEEIKAKFVKGAIPTQEDFATLIEHIENNPVLNEKADKSELTYYAKKSDVPSLEGYAKQSDIPSLEGYAKTADIPDVSGKADKPSKQSEIPTDEDGNYSNVNITADTFIEIGQLDESIDLDIHDNSYELAIKFNSGDSAETIYPIGGYWARQDDIEANTDYIFSVCNNICILAKLEEVE